MPFDLAEMIKRLIKYLVMGLMIAVVAFAIPKKSLNVEEMTIIGLSAAATFCILDTFLPSFAGSVKQGLGFAIGTGLTGGIKLM